MNSNLRIPLGCMTLVWIAMVAGCGTSDPRAEVIGELTLNGDPVEQAQVYLSAKSSDRNATNTFSASVVDGTFEFSKIQGPPPGEYEVFIQPVEDDPEEILERVMEKKGTGLADRNQFLSAVARKGPIRIDLLADEINEVSIQLTTR